MPPKVSYIDVGPTGTIIDIKYADKIITEIIQRLSERQNTKISFENK